jgi:hypothetical protein
MNRTEADELIDRINLTPPWYRKPKARTLGQRLRLTNEERLRWRIRTIAPYDMTDEQLAEQRRAHDRERKRRKRQQTRAQYLASFAQSKAQTKPWTAAGIGRRAWYYRKSKERIALGASAIKLNKATEQPSAIQQAESLKRGCPSKTNETPNQSACRKNKRDLKRKSYIDADTSKRPQAQRNNPVQCVSPGIGHNSNPRCVGCRPVQIDWRRCA